MEDAPEEEPTLVTLLPLVGPNFNNISRLPTRRNIETASLTPRNFVSFLRPVKDDKCGTVHIGQTGRSSEARTKKHHWHISRGLLHSKPRNYPVV